MKPLWKGLERTEARGFAKQTSKVFAKPLYLGQQIFRARHFLLIKVILKHGKKSNNSEKSGNFILREKNCTRKNKMGPQS